MKEEEEMRKCSVNRQQLNTADRRLANLHEWHTPGLVHRSSLGGLDPDKKERERERENGKRWIRATHATSR